MADYVTKKDLEKALDEHQRVIIDAVSAGFERVTARFEEVERELSEIRATIRELTTSIHALAKVIQDQKEEFIILKGEVDQMKRIMKEKWGVEISAVGWKL